MEKSIKNRFYDLVQHHFNPQQKIQESHHLQNDYGADSLDTVELRNDVDDEFDICTLDGREDKLHTVGDWLTYIQNKLDEKET